MGTKRVGRMIYLRLFSAPEQAVIASVVIVDLVELTSNNRKILPTLACPCFIISGCSLMTETKKSDQTTSPNTKVPSAFYSDLSPHAQILMLVQCLERSLITALEANCELKIIHLAERFCELRNRGYEIISLWFLDQNTTVRPHRVARYVLINQGGAT
jgi:hypothetical protein